MIKELISYLMMDGDGAYVWSCYLLTIVVLLGNVMVAKRRHTKMVGEITAQHGELN